MSFGLLKHFKDHKKVGDDKTKTTFTQHLILGHDLGAVLRLLKILKDHPGESVRLVSNKPLNRKILVESYDFGVTQLRSQEEIPEIYREFHNAKIASQKKKPIFYKDGKFHEFQGRAKSMELLAGEEFFTALGHKLDVQSLFSEEDWNNLDEILKSHHDMRIIQSIKKTAVVDLVEKTEWSLSFKDFSIMTSETLYVSMSPKKFLNLLENKEALTPELIDLCSSVNVQSAITLTWELSKELYPEEQTLLIPQSMTHEWGHFIVEFEKTLCHVLFLINEEEPQSEDLAGKIKLMKRVLDRVFPDFEKSVLKEYIRFDDEMFISGVKDAVLEQVGFDYPSLKFIGQMSPSTPEHKYLFRSLKS
jgi:hypothetical protein